MCGGFKGYAADLASRLNQDYGGQWTARSLPAAMRKYEELLEAFDVFAGPTGARDPATRRPLFLVAVRDAEIEDSGRLEILGPAETLDDDRDF
jgi:hypothetical protein